MSTDDIGSGPIARGPLSDIKVVELGGIGPAPFGSMILADFGAQIIRFDRPGSDLPFIDPHMRGRERFAVDLRDPAAREVVLEAISSADVVIEGFRPGVTEKLGLGPDDCFTRNKALIYARMSGWGQGGPFARVAGHDINYVALTGFLDAVGTKESGPVLPLNIIADYAGGGAMLAFGVLAAVHEARGSGLGQVVDASMLEGASYLMTKFQGFVSQGRWTEQRESNFLDGGAPDYCVYKTADSRYMAVGALEEVFYSELVRVLGLGDLPDRRDEANWPVLKAIFAEVFVRRTQQEWVDAFNGVDACVSAVVTFSEAREQPQARARDAYVQVGDLIQPTPAPRLSRTPASAGSPPTRVGEGRREALESWGLSAAQISALLDSGRS